PKLSQLRQALEQALPLAEHRFPRRVFKVGAVDFVVACAEIAVTVVEAVVGRVVPYGPVARTVRCPSAERLEGDVRTARLAVQEIACVGTAVVRFVSRQ